MRKGGNHATTTGSSETEIKLPKAVMLAEMRAAGKAIHIIDLNQIDSP